MFGYLETHQITKLKCLFPYNIIMQLTLVLEMMML